MRQTHGHKGKHLLEAQARCPSCGKDRIFFFFQGEGIAECGVCSHRILVESLKLKQAQLF